jgi:hypothetical protein
MLDELVRQHEAACAERGVPCRVRAAVLLAKRIERVKLGTMLREKSDELMELAK